MSAGAPRGAVLAGEEGSRPLFVYGTLVTGEAESGLLTGLGRRPAKVRGALWALPAGYPALVPGGDGLVEGELVDAPGAGRLQLLDRYEGVDEGLYRREVLPVLVGLRTVDAWVYVMDHPERRGGRRVPTGRWRQTVRR